MSKVLRSFDSTTIDAGLESQVSKHAFALGVSHSCFLEGTLACGRIIPSKTSSIANVPLPLPSQGLPLVVRGRVASDQKWGKVGSYATCIMNLLQLRCAVVGVSRLLSTGRGQTAGLHTGKNSIRKLVSSLDGSVLAESFSSSSRCLQLTLSSTTQLVPLERSRQLIRLHL